MTQPTHIQEIPSLDLDQLLLDRAMEKPWGARFLSKIETLGPVVRPELGRCWTWQAYVNRGYGRFMLDGRAARTHRLVCELVYGPRDSSAHVMHLCDSRDCQRPSHLKWGSLVENNADRTAKGRSFRHIGELNGRARLTESDVLEIRARLRSGAIQTEIAAEFNVHPNTISAIHVGATWRHLAPSNDNATPREASR